MDGRRSVMAVAALAAIVGTTTTAARPQPAPAPAQAPAAAPVPPLVRENATEKVSGHAYAILDNSVPLDPERRDRRRRSRGRS